MSRDEHSTTNRSELNQAPRCLQCAYPLVHLPENRCPECGQPFDLSDPSTFYRPQIRVARDRTIQEIAVLLVTSAVLAANHDPAELEFEVPIEAAILFTMATYFAVINDRFWLSPVLFFLGFVGMCSWYCWVDSWRYSNSFFDYPLLPLAVVVGIFGASIIACTKADTNRTRQKGESSGLIHLCERIEGLMSLKNPRRQVKD